MSLVCVHSFAVTIDGYSAGPRQDLEHPLGVDGQKMMEWFFPTRTFQKLYGDKPGETGVDNGMAERGFANIGAWILGRNMFGPIRGPWPDDSWKGWWGDEPPYHVPTFVLTHHTRPPLTMKGGTTFHFVTDGIESALRQAKAAAGEKNVRIGGGLRPSVSSSRRVSSTNSTWPRCLSSSAREKLFAGLDWRALGYECVERVAGERATHIVIKKKG